MNCFECTEAGLPGIELPHRLGVDGDLYAGLKAFFCL